MKMVTLRDMTKDELLQKKHEFNEEIFNLKMRKTFKELDNPLKLRTIRRDIARIETILTEARKYNLRLTLAHQHEHQLDTVKINALGTVGTTVVFKVDSGDAAYLSKGFKKKVEVKDFIELEQGDAIVRCGTEIVKIKTLGPLEIPANNFKDRIIAESRKKYCMQAHQVHKIIEQRSQWANKPHEPLVPAIDTREKTYLSQGFNHEEH